MTCMKIKMKQSHYQGIGSYEYSLKFCSTMIRNIKNCKKSKMSTMEDYNMYKVDILQICIVPENKVHEEMSGMLSTIYHCVMDFM